MIMSQEVLFKKALFKKRLFEDRSMKLMFNKKLSMACFLCTLLSLSTNILAQQSQADELDLITTIEGNLESPKVLYIIPWAPPEDPGEVDPFSPHKGNIARRIYAPIERLEQQRLIHYYDEASPKESNLQ